MKLLTHNMLMSPGTRNGYPLVIEVEQMEQVETEFNADFIARMVEKVDYPALLQTVASVCRRRAAPAPRTCAAVVHAAARVAPVRGAIQRAFALCRS
mgnify:CR=1 FL=1